MFPYATDAESYPMNHYRRLEYEAIKNHEEYNGKVVKVYWLEEKGHLGVVVVAGKGERLGLLKG
jgi:hypothetical protein